MSHDCEYTCGCCGGELEDPERQIWCARCAEHVLTTVPPWDGTYAMVFGEPCPFQVEAA